MRNEYLNDFHTPDDEDMIYSIYTDLKTGVIICSRFEDIPIYETAFTNPVLDNIFLDSLHLTSLALDDSDGYDNFIFKIFEKMGYSEIPINEKWGKISDSKKRGVIKTWNWINSNAV